MKEPIVISIYCIIEDQGKVLLSEDVGKKGFKLPGGKVEKGELLFDAAKREVKEETGLEVEITGIISIQEYFREDGTHRLRFYTTAKVVGGKDKKMEGEVSRLSWVDKEDLRHLKKEDFFIEQYYKAVRDYLFEKVYPKELIKNIG